MANYKQPNVYPSSKDLQETMAANPLDAVVAEEADKTKLAQEAILTAIAAETDAINQYTQILDVVNESEQWLVDSVTPTLTDIIDEEKRHLSQLSKIVSDLPAFEEQWKAGENEVETGEDVSESLEESLSEDYDEYVFDLVDVVSIINEYLKETAYNDPNLVANMNKIEEEAKLLSDTNGLITASKLDYLLGKYNYTIINLEELEDRLAEKKIANDIVLKPRAIEQVIDHVEELRRLSDSVAEKEVFANIISYLEEMLQNIDAPKIDESTEEDIINDDNENFLGPKQDDEDYEIAAEDTLN